MAPVCVMVFLRFARQTTLRFVVAMERRTATYVNRSSIAKLKTAHLTLPLIANAAQECVAMGQQMSVAKFGACSMSHELQSPQAHT
jgi:hypothetical protein